MSAESEAARLNGQTEIASTERAARRRSSSTSRLSKVRSSKRLSSKRRSGCKPDRRPVESILPRKVLALIAGAVGPSTEVTAQLVARLDERFEV
jgi:hypothetical protein